MDGDVTEVLWKVLYKKKKKHMTIVMFVKNG